MSELALIVAHDRRRAIGREGRMPWHLPDDLRHFRAQTMGGVVLMGRRTFDSLGRPLAGRENWVLTRDRGWAFPGVRVLHAWEDVRSAAIATPLWVIGGGEVYRLALADADRIVSTEIDTEVMAADTWFPALEVSMWEVVARQAHLADARHAHAFEIVSRVRRHALP